MIGVLMSIQPKWCDLILIGKKTVEVRKNKPKLSVPFKVYIYETNFKNNSYWVYQHKGKLGKVIGEFVCDRINTVGWISNPNKTDWKDTFNAETCLTNTETYEYSKGNKFCEWHISNLVIYDKPKELNEFIKPCPTPFQCDICNNLVERFGCGRTILRPPQSWCYVKAEGGDSDE